MPVLKLLEVASIAAVVAGVWMMFPPAALILGGIAGIVACEVRA